MSFKEFSEKCKYFISENLWCKREDRDCLQFDCPLYKTQQREIIDILKKHGHRDHSFAIVKSDYESIATKITALFKRHIHFTKSELRDLERLTAGTSEDWCQKLNKKFGGAG